MGLKFKGLKIWQPEKKGLKIFGFRSQGLKILGSANYVPRILKFLS